MARGLSLLELLVCIAIVAVLTALATPTLVTSREAQRRVTCGVNLRTLRDATVMYMDCENRGRLPACDSPTVVRGTCTEVRIRQPFLVIAPYLDAPVPGPVGLTDSLPRTLEEGDLPPTALGIVSHAPFVCPSDHDFAPRVGLSYDFAASQPMLNMLTLTVEPTLHLQETRRHEGQTPFGPPGPLWTDLNLDSHAGIAPPGVLGCQGAFANGRVDWVGYRRRFQVP